MEHIKTIESQSKNNSSEIREKIKSGLALTSKRLIEKAKKQNLELVVFRDGKIQNIKF